MSSFTKLFTFAAVAAAGFASVNAGGNCPGARVISTNTIHVNGHDIVQTTHSCSTIDSRQTDSSLVADISGESCTTSCNNVTGILPPISDDCDTITDAVQILEGTLSSPTFTVQRNHVETLTFGTCSFFLQNTGPVTIRSTWTALTANSDTAGDACFPPHQPFTPEGLCSDVYGAWAYGATHS